MLLLHPGPASIDCEDCQEWLYDLDTGKRQTIGQGERERPIPRPKGTDTPCEECPKGSPSNAEILKLSPRNRKTYELWRRAKATGGHAVPDHLRADAILARNFAELDQVTQTIDQVRQTKMMTMLALAGKSPK